MNSHARFYGLFIPESVRTAIYLVNLFTQKYVFFNRKQGYYYQWKRKPDLYIFSPVFCTAVPQTTRSGAERFSRTLAGEALSLATLGWNRVQPTQPAGPVGALIIQQNRVEQSCTEILSQSSDWRRCSTSLRQRCHKIRNPWSPLSQNIKYPEDPVCSQRKFLLHTKQCCKVSVKIYGNIMLL